jgi:hypothetical protein
MFSEHFQGAIRRELVAAQIECFERRLPSVSAAKIERVDSHLRFATGKRPPVPCFSSTSSTVEMCFELCGSAG